MALCALLSILLMQNPILRAESGVITGTVRMPDGKPAAGVRVAAVVPPEAGFNSRNSSELAALTQTDEDGSYRLEDVPIGRYYVAAGRVDAPTYYPGVATLAGATAIAVTDGSLLTEIDFVISSESAARPPNRFNPLQQYFSLFPFNAPPVQVSGRIILDKDSAGSKLPEWITLNARNERNPGFAVRGPDVITRSGSQTLRSSVAADGTFTTSLQSGDTTILVQGLPDGYAVKSITSGSTDLLTHPLQVQAGVAAIVITVTADLRPRFRVEGRVLSGAANRSLMGEKIELVDESGSIVRIILDAQGRFEFQRLLPGSYVLRLPSSNAPERRFTVTDHDMLGIEIGEDR